MLNFTVGPVQIAPEIRKVGAEQVPYFRTPEFSALMKENERLVLKFAEAEEGARAVFLTGSGTAGMEAAVMNLLSASDKVLVIEGGSFGHRFTELCAIHQIPFTALHLKYGEALTEEHLKPYEQAGYTALLVNIHETSTGVLYDAGMLSAFCKRNEMWFLVDAISSFLADPFSMDRLGADVMIIGSQKALALPPGVSVLVLSKRAVARAEQADVRCMYLNLKSALKNGERGQTPFTPAVGILIQMNRRLKALEETGAAQEIARIRTLAEDFRSRVTKLPLEIASTSMSNAVTPIRPKHGSAYRIFEILKDEYQIWVCPNGGELADQIFRVGHIGDLTVEDNTTLLNALTDMERRGLL